MNPELKPIVEALTELARRIDAIEAHLETADPGKRSIWELHKIMEAKTALMQQIERKAYFDVAGGGYWDDENAKKEFFKLKKEIKELNQKIAGM